MKDWKILRPKGTFYVTIDSEQNKNVVKEPENKTETTGEKPIKRELQLEK